MVHSITFYQVDDSTLPVNLFNKNSVSIINGYPNSSGQLVSDASYKSAIVPVTGGKDYTAQLYYYSSTRYRIVEYAAYPQIGNTGTVLAGTYSGMIGGSRMYTNFHTSSSAKYIVWFFAYDPTATQYSGLLNTMMLETGSGASEYVPYGQTFDGNPKNTWEDWHIVASSRPVFLPPPLKTGKLDIPGGNGSIDLSESLTGYPLFENSTGSLEFIVLNDYLPWQETYSVISDYLHGQKLRAVLEDDPLYYREGRFTVNSWKSDKNYSRITIDYDIFPYKIKIRDSEVTLYCTTTEKAFYLKSDFYGDMPTVPTLKVEVLQNRGARIRFFNRKLHLTATKQVTTGTYQFPELLFYGDHTEVYFKADAATVYLEDSSGGSILDNNGNHIGAEPNAQVTITCQNGGLG